MRKAALLSVALLAACDGSADPLGVEDTAPPPATEGLSLAVLPVPDELQGCGLPATYVPTGALYQICWPAAWNGSFIVYAHGYVSELQPLAIPSEATALAAFAASQGLGFASTSYSTNGLAIREGIEDVRDLADIVRAAAAAEFPAVGFVPVLVTGASEGGLVATHVAERFGDVFQGGLSTCGPTASFQRQLDYFEHFNVLFNYFFPSVFADGSGGLLVTPTGVSPSVIAGWVSYVAQVSAAVAAHPAAAQELLTVARVPVDPNDPAGSLTAILGILWYNVFATNDGIAELGGSPFDNRWTWYHGSSNDWRLNRLVRRYTADTGARHTVAQHYETSGELAMPYVSLHTTGDPIVLFEQQPLYRLKALLNGSSAEHSALPVLRYGHCNFELGDLTVGLGLLLLKIGASSPELLAQAMPNATARSTFLDLADRR